MTISVVAENVLYKIQYPFIIKLLNKLYLEGICSSAIWIMYDKRHIILNEEKLHFSLRWETKHGHSHFYQLQNLTQSNDVNARHETKRGE